MDKIPFIAFESALARCERIIHRLVIIIIALILLLVITNLLWICYENQFEDVTTTTEITQDLSSENGNAIINDGVHINGESKTNS